MNASAIARGCLGLYLVRVRAALDHLSGSERRGVIEELRSHVQEELVSRGRRRVLLADVQAVLASMDSPREYRQMGGDRVTAFGIVVGRLGLYLFALAFVMTLAGLVYFLIAERFFGPAFNTAGILLVLTTILGFVGWRSWLGRVAAIGSALTLGALLLFFQVLIYVFPSLGTSPPSA